MDYGIEISSGSLSGSMSFEPCESLANNVFLSLAVERGSFFHRPEFGLRRRDRLKNTLTTAKLLQHDYEEALQWLVDTGRATEITVQIFPKPGGDSDRLGLAIVVQQANGGTIKFNTFREVV